MVRKNINTANNVLTNTLPWLADELVTMAMDKSVKSTEKAPCSERVNPLNQCSGGSSNYEPGVGRTPWD